MGQFPPCKKNHNNPGHEHSQQATCHAPSDPHSLTDTQRYNKKVRNGGKCKGRIYEAETLQPHQHLRKNSKRKTNPDTANEQHQKFSERFTVFWSNTECINQKVRSEQPDRADCEPDN